LHPKGLSISDMNKALRGWGGTRIQALDANSATYGLWEYRPFTLLKNGYNDYCISYNS
jgi:hypothetical protein